MTRTLATGTALVFLLTASGPLFAATKTHKTPEQVCKAQAKKEHVSSGKMQAYMDSCIAKHQKPASTSSSTKPAK